MKFRVLHHNNCFDGACSAALFTKLHRECLGGCADGYEYCGLQHGPMPGVAETVFGAGENAIVDFKYSLSPKLTWWFDHHQSAFQTGAERVAFEAEQARLGAASQRFFDADYVSCTGLIADVGRARFGLETAGLEELLKWANIIDGARFESAEAAVEMKEPAMKIALVIENVTEKEFIPRIIPLLTAMPLAEVLAQPFVQEKVAPLWARHLSSMELIRQRAELVDGVVYFDLTDGFVEGLNKFTPYYFNPSATYTVGLTRSGSRTKISVGTNPWTTVPFERLVNLAAVCESFGGGGHARVGAISLPPEQVGRGQEVAQGIVADLRAAERVRVG